MLQCLYLNQQHYYSNEENDKVHQTTDSIPVENSTKHDLLMHSCRKQHQSCQVGARWKLQSDSVLRLTRHYRLWN